MAQVFKNHNHHLIQLFALSAFAFISACTPQEEQHIIKVESISIEQADMTMEVGESTTLSAKLLPEDADDKTVKWSSSDESKVMVSSSGKVVAMAIGQAVVTAQAGEAKDFITVTVVARAIAATGISIKPTELTIKVGETGTLTPEITPQEATNKKVTWASSNVEVATVEDGTVTGVKPGGVTITATTEDGGHKAECVVTVKNNLAPSVTIGADNISAVSAILKGKANLESTASSDLKVGFQYSKSAGILPSNSATIEASDADSDYYCSVGITGLEPDTKYYFRNFVRQNGQDSFGETLEFTTKELSSLLHTQEATAVSAVSARLNSVSDMTDIIYKEKLFGFYWGAYAESLTNKISAKEGAGSISADISELTPSTLYFYQPFVVLDGIELKESVLSFTTKDIKSLLETKEASGIEATSAVLNAKLDLTDVIYESISYGFYWGDSENTLSNNLAGGEIVDNSFTVSLTDLPHKTQYWYKAYVKLDNQTFYGEVKTFTTDVVPVETVSLDNTEYTFHFIGNTLTLNATVLPSDATEKSVKWSSSDELVATVDQSGNVESVGYGNAVITATSIDQGKTAMCAITVNQWVTSIFFDKLSIPLIVGDSVSANANVSPSNATDKSLVWSSSDASIATVNPSTGVVVAAKRGIAVITATANDGSEVYASYKAIVRNPVPEGAVDLGLSVHWATSNLSVYSDYFGQDMFWFSWGSPSALLKFWANDYKWHKCGRWECGRTGDDRYQYSKYVTNSYYGDLDNKTVLDLSDDVAYYYLGDNWRTPTAEECKELLENCTCMWTTKEGQTGVLLSSTIEGFENSWIFLPAMGYRPGVTSTHATFYSGNNTQGYYWSSSLYLDNMDSSAWLFFFDSEGAKMSSSLRFDGLTIRPVSE